LATIVALLALAPSAIAGRSWRYCRGGSGGAFNTRVLGLSCRYGAYVTEKGLRPGLRRTRVGGFSCTRHRSGSLWSYTCSRARGRGVLRFNTY
jgi:hypothetical protein